MSDITRTMRCPRCERTDTHTIDRSIAGEPVACWTCSGEGHRVACVVTPVIEPTEEQKRAANAFVTKGRVAEDDSPASMALARLLAEREHKL